MREIMKRACRSPLLWILLIELIMILVLFLSGFRLMYAPNCDYDWEAISAVGGWCSAIATFCAVIVALNPPVRKRLKMHFVFSPDYQPYEGAYATLILSNTGNREIVPKRICIMIGDDLVGEKILINDEYWLAAASVICIQPSETKFLEFYYNEMRSGIGHFSELSSANKNMYVNIVVYDIDEKCYSHRTKHTFELYYNLVFNKLKHELSSNTSV